MFADDELCIERNGALCGVINSTWISHKNFASDSDGTGHLAGNKVTRFIALTALFAIVRIARSDILLDKEEAMIRELVHLLSGDSRVREI